MSVLLIMIPMALVLGAIFVFGFIRSVNSGQMDDLETPAYRILKDDMERKETK